MWLRSKHGPPRKNNRASEQQANGAGHLAQSTVKLRGGFLGVVSSALRLGDGTSVLDRDISAFGGDTLRALVLWDSGNQLLRIANRP